MFSKLFKLFKKSRNSNIKGYEDILKSVDEFKNRTIYKDLTVDIIDKTPDNNLLQTVFDNLSEKISWDDGTAYSTLLTLSEPRRAIFVIWCLQCEVMNGGFNQLYFNSSGQFADLMPRALQLIGANQFADVVTRANNTYKEEYNKITEFQDGSLEGFSKSYEDNPLNKLDEEFYNLQKAENLDQLQIDLIRNNKIDFIDK